MEIETEIANSSVFREERRTTKMFLCSLLSFGILGCFIGLDFFIFPRFIF